MTGCNTNGHPEIETLGPTPPKEGMKPGALQHPLGSIVYRIAARRPARARTLGGLISLASFGLLGLAAWMEPDPSGMGTHRQLGLPPCSSVVLLGRPCPTCGMTTAFSNAVRGRFLAAFMAQPAGFLLAVATAVAAGLSLSVAVTGRIWYLNWYRVSPVALVVWVIAIVVASWLFKLLVGS